MADISKFEIDSKELEEFHSATHHAEIWVDEHGNFIVELTGRDKLLIFTNTDDS